MASLNKVQLIGNLGKDPDVRYMPSGEAVTNITLATTDTWKDKTSGDTKEATEWHRVVFFKKLAEIAGQYLKKGSQVYIEGSLKTRKWTDKDGQERYTTEIVADEMKMLGSRGQSSGSESGQSSGGQRPTGGNASGSGESRAPQQDSRNPAMANAGSGFPFDESDVPF